MTLEAVFDSIPRRWWMEQHPTEIHDFAAYLREHWIAGSAVLELGVRHGGTSALWHQLLPDAPIVIGVDRIGPDSYQDPEFHERAKSMEQDLARYRFIEGDTRLLSTWSKVNEALGDTPLGFLFIDADHSDAGVRNDYATYQGLVRPEGLIAFHDIVDSPRTGGGVARFWKTLIGTKREFCVGADWGGIGVIQK